MRDSIKVLQDRETWTFARFPDGRESFTQYLRFFDCYYAILIIQVESGKVTKDRDGLEGRCIEEPLRSELLERLAKTLLAT